MTACLTVWLTDYMTDGKWPAGWLFDRMPSCTVLCMVFFLWCTVTGCLQNWLTSQPTWQQASDPVRQLVWWSVSWSDKQENIQPTSQWHYQFIGHWLKSAKEPVIQKNRQPTDQGGEVIMFPINAVTMPNSQLANAVKTASHQTHRISYGSGACCYDRTSQ